MEVHLSEDELVGETSVSDERHPVFGVIFRQTQQNCKIEGKVETTFFKESKRFRILLRILHTRVSVIDQRQGLANGIVISQMDRQEVLGLGCGRDDVDRRLFVPTAQFVEIVPMGRICKVTRVKVKN